MSYKIKYSWKAEPETFDILHVRALAEIKLKEKYVSGKGHPHVKLYSDNKYYGVMQIGKRNSKSPTFFVMLKIPTVVEGYPIERCWILSKGKLKEEITTHEYDAYLRAA